MKRPNILILMVDEERYPTVYETESIKVWRKKYLKAQDFLRENGFEFRNHYAASCACAPSRASIYTGQYPSLHGVSQTPGIAKGDFDSDMTWLSPNTVPTFGDYLLKAGYQTYWKGKCMLLRLILSILVLDIHLILVIVFILVYQIH